ncbi:aryl-alcohol dehydrogenase-like predicted oxidoreductase [Mucilaginibacter sp. UYNi724]
MGQKYLLLPLAHEWILRLRKSEKKAKKQTIETLKHAIDSGISFLNTADFYGMGFNELTIYEAIKGRRKTSTF